MAKYTYALVTGTWIVRYRTDDEVSAGQEICDAIDDAAEAVLTDLNGHVLPGSGVRLNGGLLIKQVRPGKDGQ